MLAGFRFPSPLIGSRELLDRLSQLAAAESHADRASIMLSSPASTAPVLRASTGVPIPFGAGGAKSNGVAALVARQGRPLAICNDHLDGADVPRELLSGGAFCSLILPLLSENRTLGVLNLSKATRDSHFTRGEVYRAAVLATIAAPSIEASIAVDLLSRELRRAKTDAQEIRHRLLNSLSDVMGILYLQSNIRRGKGLPADEGLEETLGAVQSMVTTNMILGQSLDDQVDFGDLATSLIESFRNERLVDKRNIRVSYDLQTLALPAKSARSLAIVLLELISNSVKHAFSGQGGALEIRFVTSGGDALLTVTDDGQGHAEQQPGELHSGLGLRIVRTLVKRDLRGKVEVRDGSPGTVTVVSFPAPAGMIYH